MLHGKIEVNHVEIGQWSAVRVETVFTGMHKYDCFVEYRNHEGYSKRAEFQVIHFEKNGALVLAKQVLGTAIQKMK